MRLHYYTTAVPNSYCVGVHNGHGFGSLFARLFFKVAAKTAAKAAVKVAAKTAARAAASAAKNAGRKALKVITTKGADIAKKAAKEAIKKAAEAGGDFAAEKIASLTEKALKTKLPEDLVHSVSDIAKQGVKAVGSKATSAAGRSVDTLIDKGVSKAERVAGIQRAGKRKQPPVRVRAKKKKVAVKRTAVEKKWNSIVQLMNDE